MASPMDLDFHPLPRGSFRATCDGWELDVWPVGGGWRWTTLAPNGRYAGGGEVATAFDAKRAALFALAHTEG